MHTYSTRLNLATFRHKLCTIFGSYNLLSINCKQLASNRMSSLKELFRVRVMVFNTTFNNISAILWWAVLLVEETRVPEENHLPAASQLSGFKQTSLVAICTDCTGSCKSNYQTITTMMAP